MGGVVSAARRRGTCGLIVLGAFALVVARTPSAQAVDFLEGNVQVHGYFEEQVRGISRNFNEQLDLTQWANILRIDTDVNLIQNPIGPLESLRSYTRIEVRYDCVYTRACGLFPNANVYGDRARQLPDRLANAKLQSFDGVIPLGAPTQALIGNRPGGLDEVYGFQTLFGFPNPDGRPADAPALYTFKDYLDYRFAQRKTPGGLNGLQVEPLGPWLPSNLVIQNAGLIHIANPFSSQDFNPILPITNAAGQVVSVGGFGSGALPFRPAPMISNASPAGNLYNAQGIYYPSQGLVNYLNTGRPGTTNAQYSQSDLAWDHGASQSETYEFREGYLHAEFLDGRAWLRVGKQLIVWGKTELFATTDQFNPRDLAISSLPSLEESRIPVWAARAVYNFYTVGPFEDVRLEGALNLDKFTPDDIGVCGEPYAANPVCDKAFGLFAHGTTGVGLAGQTSPPDWWQSTQGLQGGARLEFRWDRYSFALVDIYNYVRIPYVNQINTYSRNVDPFTGMPRFSQSTGSCQYGGRDASGNAIAIGSACLTPATALRLQSANQTLFAMICSTTVGFSPLDRSACAQTVLGSGKPAPPLGAPVSGVLSGLLAGDPGLNAAASPTLGAGQLIPFVNLKFPGAAPQFFGQSSLSAFLSPQQQALLGCGPFYHTVCNGYTGSILGPKIVPGGIDLLNMEASVVTQSFVGFEGTSPGWFTNNRSVAQPGTVGFEGGPVGTRFVNGMLVTLPGARSPGTPGYSVAVDGNPANVGFNTSVCSPTCPTYFTSGQPFTGQPFSSVMAGFSWNLEMLLVTTSTNFTAANELSSTACGWIRPELCTAVGQFMTVTGVQRNDVQAGGNGRFGRRDFVWDSAGEVNLQYQRRNVLGFSMDFAEDVTKSNWGIEFGWEQHLPFLDNNQVNNLSKSDDLELSISVDRPTFINFLNQNRTFFFNAQFFISYLTSYHTSFQIPGPFGVLGTFTISTGYFQDRLLPSLTFVYDVFSNSGAALPELQYRFTENFSLAIGIEQFLGRFRGQTMPLNPIATVSQQTGSEAYKTFYEPGLSVIRDRDEAYFRLRYSF
ncbi:MAG TPA: DUF1302 family protein [Myxococcota bacterium]|nr:DUF1302 family protein [Myxococcota bacterium]